MANPNPVDLITDLSKQIMEIIHQNPGTAETVFTGHYTPNGDMQSIVLVTADPLLINTILSLFSQDAISSKVPETELN